LYRNKPVNTQNVFAHTVHSPYKYCVLPMSTTHMTHSTEANRLNRYIESS